jgi:hypothetical protein
MSAVREAAALALAVGAASYITSTAKISRRPRVWLANQESPAGKWFFELASCPLCTATWMALAATAIYRPLLVRKFWPADYLVTALAVTAGAMVPVAVIKKAVAK